MCNIALVTFLWLQYWSAWLIKIYEHRKTCIYCVLRLVKPTKISWNLLKKNWSWNFTSCSWEPCEQVQCAVFRVLTCVIYSLIVSNFLPCHDVEFRLEFCMWPGTFRGILWDTAVTKWQFCLSLDAHFLSHAAAISLLNIWFHCKYVYVPFFNCMILYLKVMRL